MRNVFGRIGLAVARFMRGRNGIDRLAVAALWAGLICAMLSGPMRSGLLSLTGTALYGWTLFRMLSRNTARRAEENRRFTAAWGRATTAARQWLLRVRNSRTYKYFRCPQCRARLRLRRGCGEKNITCPRCGHAFTQKA